MSYYFNALPTVLSSAASANTISPFINGDNFNNLYAILSFMIYGILFPSSVYKHSLKLLEYLP